MQRYHYVARNQVGEKVKGQMLAINYAEFAEKVKKQNLFIVDYSYEEEGEEKVAAFKLKGKQLVLFTNQLATLISSGIPMVSSINILYEKSLNKKFKPILLNVYEGIQQGKYLSQCMDDETGVFPPLLVKMIRAGEISGTLDQVLMKMSHHYEKENRLNNKVKAALMYPTILGVVTVVVVIFLVSFVLPTFFVLFEGQDIPFATQLVVAISNFMTTYWYICILGVAIIYMVWSLLLKTEKFRMKYDRFKLKMPVFGVLNRTIYSARFSRTFASLHAAGLSIIDNLETSAMILNNLYLKNAMDRATLHISEGELISTAIDKEDIFDPMLTSMIYIGEESGTLDMILEKTANFYEEEADAATTKMVSLIEPIMIVAMALIIGTVIIAVLLPILDMYGSIGV